LWLSEDVRWEALQSGARTMLSIIFCCCMADENGEGHLEGCCEKIQFMCVVS